MPLDLVTGSSLPYPIVVVSCLLEPSLTHKWDLFKFPLVGIRPGNGKNVVVVLHSKVGLIPWISIGYEREP